MDNGYLMLIDIWVMYLVNRFIKKFFLILVLLVINIWNIDFWWNFWIIYLKIFVWFLVICCKVRWNVWLEIEVIILCYWCFVEKSFMVFGKLLFIKLFRILFWLLELLIVVLFIICEWMFFLVFFDKKKIVLC